MGTWALVGKPAVTGIAKLFPMLARSPGEPLFYSAVMGLAEFTDKTSPNSALFTVELQVRAMILRLTTEQ